MILDNIRISPISFGDGGKPSFAAQNRSHHNDIIIFIFLKPLVTNIFRVFVRSYIIFARENNAEDTRPWAIINIIVPLILHFEKMNIPEATMLM